MENSKSKTIKRATVLTLLVFSLCWLSFGCGSVGPLTAPEDIGIEAKLREQQRSQNGASAKTQEEEKVPIEEEEIQLPPLQPINTQ